MRNLSCSFLVCLLSELMWLRRPDQPSIEGYPKTPSSFQPPDFLPKYWPRLLLTPCIFGREHQTSLSPLQPRNLCGRLLRYIARYPTNSVGNDSRVLLIKTNSFSVVWDRHNSTLRQSSLLTMLSWLDCEEGSLKPQRNEQNDITFANGWGRNVAIGHEWWADWNCKIV
jgi:hypothetical protein